MLKSSDVILMYRYGNFRQYSLKNGCCKVEIMLCMNRDVYVNPGYYLTVGQCLPEKIMLKCYPSGKSAALAAIKYLSKYKAFPTVKIT